MSRVCKWAAILLILMTATCRADDAPADESATAFEMGQWGPIALLRGQERLVEVVADRLRCGDVTDRQRAAFALGQVGTAAAVDALVGALDDEARQVRIHAAVALTQVGRAEGYPGARVAFDEGPEWLQYYAVHGMYRTDAAACLRLLEQRPVSGSPFLSRIIAAARRHPLVQWPPGPFYGGMLEADDWEHAVEHAAGALVDEADIWFHGGDYDQAIRCNEAAVFLQPAWVQVYSNSGWLLWSMNRHGAAVRTYRRAMEANPDDWEAHFELGYYYLLQSRPTPALQHLKRSVDLGAPPIRARSYAHALERSGRLADALDFWRELAKMDDCGVVQSNIRRLQEILGGRDAG